MRDEIPDSGMYRYRANIQLGDGPDRRGDVTVEHAVPAEGVDPETVRDVWQTEMGEAREYLEMSLGLSSVGGGY